MARAEATLATELEALGPTSNAAAAVQTIGDSYGVYMGGATSNGVPLTGAAGGVSAMAAALAFPVPSTFGEAGAALAAGVSAFWDAMVAAPSTFFAGASVITPPAGLAALPGSLAAVLAANIGQSLESCAAAIAAAIHDASTGGTATFPGPTVAPVL